MTTTATPDAFNDLIAELRSTGRPLAELAAEIAADYGVNPAFLTRKFAEVYPDGLPTVDLEGANRLAEQVAEKDRRQNLAERQAIVEFFTRNPESFRSAPRAARRIVAQAAEEALTYHVVQAAIAKWPCRYTTRSGEVVSGGRIDEVRTHLRELGFSIPSYFDHHDIERLGVRIVEAEYTGGAHRTGKFIRVAVLDRKTEAA